MIQQDTPISTENRPPQGQTTYRPGGMDAYGLLCFRAEAAYRAGRTEEAIRLYEDAIRGGLDRPAAYRTLGQLYLSVRQYEAADQSFQYVARTMPISSELLDQWVWALLGQGRIDQARQVIDQTLADPSSSGLALNPLARALQCDDPSSLRLVADTLFKAGQWELSREIYRKLADLEPSVFVYGRLGHICRISGALSEAADYTRKALAVEPDNAECLANLGSTSILLGRIEEGVATIKQALDKEPGNAVIHSFFLITSNYLPHSDRASLFEEHRRWGQRHAPMSLARRTHDNDPDPDRPLRIGYLCADFKMHSVSYNFEPLLDRTDRRSLRVFGYGSVGDPDHVTRRLAARFDAYRDVYGLADEAVADLIRQDRMDILVAVAGHTGGHRLRVMAYKPAPIQVDMGSIATLGMEQVDYRLTDTILDPPEFADFCVEELVTLQGGYVCYRPPEFAPAVGPLPATRQGFVTFGSFNGSPKIHPGLVSLWAAILKSVEGARLLMKCSGGDDPALTEHYLRLFEQGGVSRDRVRIRGRLSPVEHLDLYNQVDVALDTYPYNGCVTTLEGLWMGVPTVTRVGQTLVSRVGLSILSRVGLDRLVTSTPQDYVAKASALARNTEALVRIRSSLRQRMAASPLCNADRIAREIETAYRRMWRRWCECQKSEVGSQKSESGRQGGGR